MQRSIVGKNADVSAVFEQGKPVFDCKKLEILETKIKYDKTNVATD